MQKAKMASLSSGGWDQEEQCHITFKILRPSIPPSSPTKLLLILPETNRKLQQPISWEISKEGVMMTERGDSIVKSIVTREEDPGP